MASALKLPPLTEGVSQTELLRGGSRELLQRVAIVLIRSQCVARLSDFLFYWNASCRDSCFRSCLDF